MTGAPPAHVGQLAALADIASRSTTLDERLGLPDGRGSTPGLSPSLPRSETDGQANAAGAKLLDDWARNVARGSMDLFSRRLTWDGVDADGLAGRLAPPVLSPEQLPRWVSLLQDAYGWGRGASTEAAMWPDQNTPDEERAIDPGQSLPFEELFLPLIRHARRQVELRAKDHQTLTAEAHAAFERALLTQLTRICAQALYVGFAAFRSEAGAQAVPSAAVGPGPSRSLYLAFLASMKREGLLSFFREHSVAARLCATTTENCIDFVLEFLGRLEEDRPALERMVSGGGSLEKVISVQVGLSDAHDGGRGVIICRFQGSLRLVYKPRSVALEQFFAELVAWSNSTGEMLPLRAAKVLSFDSHGWIEWIGPLPCTDEAEVKRFYRRCGMLLGMLHGVHATDVHSGNLLASGEYPVLIDMETLLTPAFELESAEQQSAPPILRFFDTAAAQPVTRTLLTPWLKFSPEGLTMELGGLTTNPPASQAMQALGWCDVNTDLLRLGAVPVPVEAARNFPVLADRGIVAADYLEEVLVGFRQMYDLLLARRHELLVAGGLLERLGSQRVRFIIRHTNLYATLLERTLHPRFLRDGATRTIELDVLARPLLELPRRPLAWSFLRAERCALEQMDVPLFSARADSLGLRLPTGEVIQDCFNSSAASEARRKLGELSVADRNLQEDLVRAAFAGALAPGLAASLIEMSGSTGDDRISATGSSESPALTEAARTECERLGQAIADRARVHQGSPLWMAPAYFSPARRHNAGSGRAVLLDGSAGIALALAAVAAVTGRRDLASLARAGLEPLCGSVRELASRLARGTWDAGLGTGAASCAYGLMRAADLLGQPALLEVAKDWAALLDPAGLHPKASPDILSGRAGALLLLVRLHARTGRAELLDRALRFAEDLLVRRTRDGQTGLQVWITRHGRAETGLAHGQSGIAYALAEAAAVSGRTDLREAADEAIAFERQSLGADLAGTERDNVGAAWSTGAAGIGLVRTAMLGLKEDVEARRDLQAAVERTRQHLYDGTDDLCSGFQGRIELLRAAAGPLQAPHLLEQARHAAGRRLAHATSTGGCHLGWHGGYLHPGLFQGLAGLAYSWARLVDPQRVPSVALWA